MGELASHERYANFSTDFAFKKNLYKLLDRPAALQEAVFKRFFEQAEIANFSLEERRDYRESQKDFWDLFAVTETAEKKGRAEERIEIAKKLKALGIPAETIAQSTGLAIDEINEL